MSKTCQPTDIVAARKSGYTNFEKSDLKVYLRKCLPSIVIFGVSPTPTTSAKTL
jgi:hypothetical protein